MSTYVSPISAHVTILSFSNVLLKFYPLLFYISFKCISFDKNDGIIVNVSSEKSIYSLKSLIKNHMAPFYNDVPLNELFLYKCEYDANKVVETYKGGENIPITLVNPQKDFLEYFDDLNTIVVSICKMDKKVSRSIINGKCILFIVMYLEVYMNKL